jgi:hypothetical protein
VQLSLSLVRQHQEAAVPDERRFRTYAEWLESTDPYSSFMGSNPYDKPSMEDLIEAREEAGIRAAGESEGSGQVSHKTIFVSLVKGGL